MRDRMKERFHNWSKPESRALAPNSLNPASRPARFRVAWPWLRLTYSCWTISNNIHAATCCSFSTTGMKSFENIRDSTSVANMSNQTQGMRTATPEIDGDCRWTPNHARPSHTVAWATRSRHPSVSDGMRMVRRITMMIPPIQRTWSETACWLRSNAIEVKIEVRMA